MISRLGGSLLLVVAEAAWVTVLFGALADGATGPDRPAIDLPFLAIALPAVAAVVVAGFVGARHGRRVRWVATTVVVLVLAAVTAELVSSLTPGVDLWAAPALPVAVRAVTWASVVSVLAWGRGTWLGLTGPSVQQASASCLVGAVVVVFVEIRRAAGHSPAFGRATQDVGWLLVVFFMAGVAAVAWANEQSVERAAMRRAGRGPGGAWLAVMAVPLVGLVLVASLLGGGAGVAGPAVVQGARDLGSVITHLFDLLHLNFRIHPSAHSTPGTTIHHVQPSRPGRVRSNGFATDLGYVLLGLVTVAAVGLIGVAGLWMVRRVRRHRRATETPEEDRDSVFTWSHFWAQLRAALTRVRRRRPVPRSTLASAVVTATPTAGAELDPVRAAYREFLVAARSVTLGRSPSETPREFRTRLTLDRRALSALTGAYERVRYGMQDPEEGRATAAEAVETLTTALEGRPSTPQGSPEPSTERP